MSGEFYRKENECWRGSRYKRSDCYVLPTWQPLVKMKDSTFGESNWWKQWKGGSGWFSLSVDSISVDKTLLLYNRGYQEMREQRLPFSSGQAFWSRADFWTISGYGRLLRILMKFSFLAILKDGFFIFWKHFVAFIHRKTRCCLLFHV